MQYVHVNMKYTHCYKKKKILFNRYTGHIYFNYDLESDKCLTLGFEPICIGIENWSSHSGTNEIWLGCCLLRVWVKLVIFRFICYKVQCYG